MKKFLILSTLLLIAVSGWSQLFELELDISFRRADSSRYDLALVGGLNQPQFSNIDINTDGQLDMFIFDRSGNKVICLISVLDTSTGEVSYFYDPQYDELFPAMTEFMLLTDYNNDNKPDLWTYNPMAFTARPQLFKNVSDNYIEFEYVKDLKGYNFDRAPFDTSLFVHWPGTLPDVVDLDGDGDQDYVSNTALCGSNITYYCNNSIDRNIGLDNIDFEIPDYCLGNLGEDGIEVTLNERCDFGRNYRKKKHCGKKTFGFFDNDGDGDLDLFFGTSEQFTNPLYFVENGKSDLAMDIDTFIALDTTYFPEVIERQIPVAPTISFVDVDLDGINDLVLSTNEVATLDYSVPQTENVLYFRNKGTQSVPDYDFKQNDMFVGDMIDFGSFTAPQLVDLDGDGDLDLVIATNGDHAKTGDTTHHLVYFENIGIKGFPEFILRDSNFLELKQDALKQFIPEFADIDNDTDQDMFLGMPDGTIRYYENTVSGFQLTNSNYANIQVNERAAPCVHDLDGDGLLDLLVGSYTGNIHYYKNIGSKTAADFQFEDDTLGGVLTNIMVKKTVIGGPDTFVHHFFGSSSLGVGVINEDVQAIYAIGDEGKLRIFLIPDDLKDTFVERHNIMNHDILNTLYSKDFGSDAVITTGDLDKDGYDDVVIGNSRGGIGVLMGRDKGAIDYSETRATVGIYPNPNRGVIHVSLKGANKFEYQILDLRGRVVQNGSQLASKDILIDAKISNGMYLLFVQDDNIEYQPQKFILNR